MAEARKQFDLAYEQACTALEEDARKVLKQCHQLREYVAANGDAFFITNKGLYVDSSDAEDRCTTRTAQIIQAFEDGPLEQFQDMFDCRYSPVRFTRNGPRVTEWQGAS